MPNHGGEGPWGVDGKRTAAAPGSVQVKEGEWDFHSGSILHADPDQESLVPVPPAHTVSLPWAKATTYKATFCPASFPSPWLLPFPNKAETRNLV